MPKLISSDQLKTAVVVAELPVQAKRPARVAVASSTGLEDILGKIAGAIKQMADLHLATQKMIDGRQPQDVPALAAAVSRVESVQRQIARAIELLVEERVAPPAVNNITVIHPQDEREIIYSIVRDGYGNITKVKRSVE
jgi:hypothetical protein